jgi:hypothetical protein
MRRSTPNVLWGIALYGGAVVQAASDTAYIPLKTINATNFFDEFHFWAVSSACL